MGIAYFSVSLEFFAQAPGGVPCALDLFFVAADLSATLTYGALGSGHLIVHGLRRALLLSSPSVNELHHSRTQPLSFSVRTGAAAFNYAPVV